MSARRRSDRGAADAAALAAALVLGTLAFAPTLLLRRGEGWRKCNEEALRIGDPHPDPRPTSGRTDLQVVLYAVQRAPAWNADPFRPDPARRLGPAAAAPDPVPPAPTGTSRVADLDGKVIDGRLSVRWTPAPGSRATSIRIEGLEADPIEREVPAAASVLDLPVPGTSGTIVVKAAPAGGTETRVSIPYRIAVEVVRAERARGERGGAILRLRRAFDGAFVEADFELRESDTVGDLTAVAAGGPEVDFRTDLVLEEVRDLRAPGPFVEVPLFTPEGRVQRDAEGRLLSYGRASTVDAGQEIVLRGPNDERRVVPVR